MANTSFNVACKELKIAQIAEVNQIIQFLYYYSSDIRQPRLVWAKLYANEEKSLHKQWCQQRFTYFIWQTFQYLYVQCKYYVQEHW